MTTINIIENTSAIDILEFAANSRISPKYIIVSNDGSDIQSLFDICLDKQKLRNLIESNRVDDNDIIFAYVYSRIETDLTNVQEKFIEINKILKLDPKTINYYEIYLEELSFMNENVNKIINYLTETRNTLEMLTRGYFKEWKIRLTEIDYEDEIEDYNNKTKYISSLIKQNLLKNDQKENPYNFFLPVNNSLPTFSSITYLSNIVNEENVNIDGFKLFNKYSPSEDVPMVVLTINDEEKFYKIHPSFDPQLANDLLIRPFENAIDALVRRPIIKETAQKRGKRKIQEKILSEYNDQNTIQYITKYVSKEVHSYINIIIYLETNVIKIFINGRDLLDIENILDKELPPIDELVPTDISGSFIIFGDHLPPFVFQELIQNISGIDSFLLLNERIKVNMSDIQGYIFQFPQILQLNKLNMGMDLGHEIASPIRFSIENGYVTKETYDQLGNKVEIGSSKVTINFSRASSMDELDRFIIFMRLITSFVGNYQYEIFDEYYNILQIDFPDYTKIKDLQNKNILQSLKPQIFNDDYPKICSNKSQPFVIDSIEEAIGTGQIVNFPFADSNPILLQCPEEFPYMTMKVNKTSSESNSLYLPCCSKSDNEFKIERMKNYLSEGIYETQNQLQSESSIIFKTMRPLYEGQEGKVEKTNIVSLYELIGLNNGEVIRIGMAEERDNFLKCISMLLNYPDINLENILKDPTWFPEIVAQEIPDYKYIRSNLQNYLNISCYRIIEELFDCNIFIMKYEDGNLEFKLPPNWRGNSYLKRFNEGNKSIFLYESNRKENFHYEPLFYRIDNRTEIKFLTPEQGKIIYEKLFIPSVGPLFEESDYKILDIKDIPSNNPPIGQKLDVNGKCRGLVFEDVTYIFNPTAPFNLPLLEDFTSSTSLDLWKNKFKIKSMSRNYDYQGIWFTEPKTNQDIFAYVTNDINLEKYKFNIQGIPEILHSDLFEPINYIYAYQIQKERLDVLIEFMYISLHVILGWDREKWPINWDKIVLINKPTKYKFSNIPSSISRNVDIQTLLSYRTNILIETRSMKNKYKIVLYNQKFMNDITFLLKDRVKQNIDPTFVLPRVVINFKFEKELLLKGDGEYSQWVDMKQFKIKKYTKILYSYRSIYPYMYGPNEDSIFLIQPISPDKGKEGASFVAYFWRLYRINNGFNPDYTDFLKNTNNLTIKIGKESSILDEQLTDKSADFFSIDGQHFYAILPLDVNTDESLVKLNIKSLGTPYESRIGQNDDIENEIIIENVPKGRRDRRDNRIIKGGAIKKGVRRRGRPRKN